MSKYGDVIRHPVKPGDPVTVWSSTVFIVYKAHVYIRNSGQDVHRILWSHDDNAFPFGRGKDVEDEKLCKDLEAFFQANKHLI